MRNLRPLKRNYYYFQLIVARKQIAVRTALNAIQGNIQTEYRNYVSACNGNTLHSYNASAFNGVNADNLRSCYADRLEVKKLKEHIYDNQLNHLKYECQFCTIGSSEDSFDHYLPQEAFPEFSVLSNNLLPCCARCNTFKNINWKDLAGNRNIINVYYDTIPAQQFLNCTLVYRRGTPVVTFSINNPGGINGNLFQIISRHFERLDLLKRFKNKSNTEITNVTNALRPLLATHTLAQASNYLNDEVSEMKLSFGNNYWRAILQETLANSTPFLNQVGFP